MTLRDLKRIDAIKKEVQNLGYDCWFSDWIANRPTHHKPYWVQLWTGEDQVGPLPGATECAAWERVLKEAKRVRKEKPA